MPHVMTAAPASPEVTIRGDWERLQGAWTSVSGRRKIDLLIAGQNFTVRFRNGPIYMGIFKLDPAQRPKAIDMLVHEGPERHQWKTSLGIYALTGDVLRWCPNEPGRKDRLQEFPAEDHPEYYCTLFQREKP